MVHIPVNLDFLKLLLYHKIQMRMLFELFLHIGIFSLPGDMM